MKTIVILLCLVLAIHAKAQQADTLTAVNFFGTVYGVQNGNALMQTELKHIIKKNPEAFKKFKEARRIRNLAFTLQIVSIVPLVYALVAETPGQFIGGLTASLALSSTGLILIHGPYSKRIHQTISIYNDGLRSSQKELK